MSQPDPNVAVSPLQWGVEQAQSMTMLTGVSIVLPCHDEEANVGAAVAQATHAAALCAHA
ncbi:MAG TPA: hypothetical protein VNS09_04955 [Solirubrobacter sp.]|nr:hypothetical protein [Solirubrobacter sp.]